MQINLNGSDAESRALAEFIDRLRFTPSGSPLNSDVVITVAPYVGTDSLIRTVTIVGKAVELSNILYRTTDVRVCQLSVALLNNQAVASLTIILPSE